jgi:glycosyltransferase involved in cell wall biosynthesis
VERSQAGKTYKDLDSFIEGLRLVGEQRSAMSRRARTYAAKYTWPKVVDAYREEMDRIVREKSR